MNLDILNSELYRRFLDKNPGKGNLKIHAYAASEALPINGLHVVVSTSFENQIIPFFDGYTDASGMIPNISLPAAKLDFDNLIAPVPTVYSIVASFDSLEKQQFTVRMYDGISVVQNINYIPGGMNNGNSLSYRS